MFKFNIFEKSAILSFDQLLAFKSQILENFGNLFFFVFLFPGKVLIIINNFAKTPNQSENYLDKNHPHKKKGQENGKHKEKLCDCHVSYIWYSASANSTTSRKTLEGVPKLICKSRKNQLLLIISKEIRLQRTNYKIFHQHLFALANSTQTDVLL